MLWRLLKSALSPAPSAERLIQQALDLRRAGRQRDAEQVLRTAVREHPRDATAVTNLAVALLELDDPAQAVPLLERAIELDGRCAPAHFNYAHVLRSNGRLAEAVRHYEAATVADPSFAPAYEALMHAQLQACDWDSAERLRSDLHARALREAPETWMPFVSPFTAFYLGLDAERCKAVAAFHAPKPAPRVAPVAKPLPAHGRRLRIAYLSGDFRNHIMAQMLGGAFGLHDRDRFEVYAYSFAIDDGSPYRQRIAESVDKFVDVWRMNDDTAAQAIAATEIDVLVELMGHTTGNRLGILARRCAPVQAHYLGYPATIGAPYVDYYVGDAIASPPELDEQFTEQVVRVADCYQLNDGAGAFTLAQWQRSDCGLPDDAFVFCNFGSPARIDRKSFRLWMSILDATPGSLLWLLQPSAAAVDKMRREATHSGVDPARLVFGETRPKNAHISRVGCADLGLDTLEWCNGHSTTADLLWGGGAGRRRARADISDARRGEPPAQCGSARPHHAGRDRLLRARDHACQRPSAHQRAPLAAACGARVCAALRHRTLGARSRRRISEHARWCSSRLRGSLRYPRARGGDPLMV